MTREYVASANTVDEAIAIACRELGVSEEECSPEILQLPKKGLFGKIKQQAKVRVVIETIDLEDVLGVTPAAETPVAAPATPKAPAAAPKMSVAPSEPEKKAAEPVAVQPKAEPKEETPSVSVSEEPEKPVLEKTEPDADLEPKIQLARQYLQDIFAQMNIEGISVEFTQSEDRTVVIHLDGDSIGAVIGKRGETLDAIQYLVCLAANRLEGDYVRFTMNAGNYREKREETLKALAQRMAKKVLKTGRPAALEPMNPYERRIIHAVITDIDGVFSKSTGEEPNRKVVIKPTARQGSYREDRRDRRRERPARGKGGYGRKAEELAPSVSEETAAPAETRPAEARKIDDNVKLYSKIELD